jgi:hypothetical protein
MMVENHASKEDTVSEGNGAIYGNGCRPGDKELKLTRLTFSRGRTPEQLMDRERG